MSHPINVSDVRSSADVDGDTPLRCRVTSRNDRHEIRLRDGFVARAR